MKNLNFKGRFLKLSLILLSICCYSHFSSREACFGGGGLQLTVKTVNKKKTSAAGLETSKTDKDKAGEKDKAGGGGLDPLLESYLNDSNDSNDSDEVGKEEEKKEEGDSDLGLDDDGLDDVEKDVDEDLKDLKISGGNKNPKKKSEKGASSSKGKKVGAKLFEDDIAAEELLPEEPSWAYYDKKTSIDLLNRSLKKLKAASKDIDPVYLSFREVDRGSKSSRGSVVQLAHVYFSPTYFIENFNFDAGELFSKISFELEDASGNKYFCKAGPGGDNVFVKGPYVYGDFIVVDLFVGVDADKNIVNISPGFKFKDGKTYTFRVFANNSEEPMAEVSIDAKKSANSIGAFDFDGGVARCGGAGVDVLSMFAHPSNMKLVKNYYRKNYKKIVARIFRILFGAAVPVESTAAGTAPAEGTAAAGAPAGTAPDEGAAAAGAPAEGVAAGAPAGTAPAEGTAAAGAAATGAPAEGAAAGAPAGTAPVEGAAAAGAPAGTAPAEGTAATGAAGTAPAAGAAGGAAAGVPAGTAPAAGVAPAGA